MPVEFHKDGEGRLRIRASAGGHGGGVTSTFEGYATDEDIARYPREHAAYLLGDAAPVAEEAQVVEVAPVVAPDPTAP